jgi:hypothetical protein
MKRRTALIAGLSPAVVALTPSAAKADDRHGDGSAHGFDRFLRRYEAANTAFVNGDPTLWLSITAEHDPVSIFGGFGGLGETGAEAVHRRYLLAAGAFRPSGAVVAFEYLVKDVRGRLAYTVALERAQVLYTGVEGPREHFLRVTMLFRFEKGAWRIVHRHGDSMVALQLPTG